jgi:hypothetical protein
MGWKYYIVAARYPFNGCWCWDYGTQHLIPFLVRMLWAFVRFDIVDVSFRDDAE